MTLHELMRDRETEEVLGKCVGGKSVTGVILRNLQTTFNALFYSFCFWSEMKQITYNREEKNGTQDCQATNTANS